MKFILIVTLLITASFSSFAEIRQELGVDQSVDYKSLERIGPWDDRNYLLTKDDLRVLPKNDQYLANIPAFFKVFKRKEMPLLGDLYPRSTLQQFQMLHGGLIVDGIWYKEALGIGYHKDSNKPGKFQGVEVKEIRGVGIAVTETPFEIGVSGNETSVECNPLDNTKCVAGSNANGGQAMYYSSDSGVTWTKSQTNAGSCCDPAVDWSSDGSIVYQADLSGPSIGVRWTRSLDQGQNWEAMKVVTSSGSDKEWIHVDRSSISPHQDNVYLTWHDGNVMQFARSTDLGITMSPPLSFGGEETGIGSDITTDSAGNIYYVYPGLQGGGVRMLKSTDGGLTFAPGVQVAPLFGRFDFAIPSMESRRAFIYVSVDIDSNDNIYVAFTDEAPDSIGGGGGSSGDAPLRHGMIKVAKSTDGGATWNLLPSPHDTSDTIAGTPIDRFHPWLMVAENDVVHIGFYDTRHSVNRTGVDFYYNVSLDGNTWLGEQRFTTDVSPNLNDAQEWGDYNSLSVVLDKIVMSWTDNRAGKVGMAGTIENQFGEPTFTLGATPSIIEVCANDTGLSSTLQINDIQSYAGIIALSVDASPTYVNNTAFSVNNQGAPFTSDFTFDVDNSGSTGTETLTILASGDDLGTITERTVDLTVNYSTAVPGGATLTLPVDNDTGVSGSAVNYTWDAIVGASTYFIEISDDAGFSNIIESETVSTNLYTAQVALTSSTEYFWRITATNGCGIGTVSSTSSFTTSNEICYAVNQAIPDNDVAGTTFVASVADTGPIENLMVTVNSQHGWVGDLVFTLSHNGTDVTLMDQPGVPASTFGCSGDNVDATFDDSSGVAVETQCEADPAITGNVSPQEALSAFDGAELSGDWTINAADVVSALTGTLVEFCLIPEIVGGGEPTFTLEATPTDIEVCSNDTGLSTTIDVADVLSYQGDVTLSVDSAPGYVFNSAFSVNGLGTPYSSVLSFDVDNTGTNGTEIMTILGSGDDAGNITERSIDLNITYIESIPSGTVLNLPVDNDTGVPAGLVDYAWDAVAGSTSYLIEISDDAGFSNIVESASTVTNSYTAQVALDINTEYFWQVTTTNACGDGAASLISSFTTTEEICFTVNQAIPDNDPTGITFVGSISETGTLDSLTMGLNVTHTFVGDLIATLSKDGVDVNLFTQPTSGAGGTCSEDDIDATFDDASPDAAQAACTTNGGPGFIGTTLSPSDSFTGFSGVDLDGDWTFNLSDNAGADLGTLNTFCITPVLQEPCDLPPPVGDDDIIWFNGFQCVQPAP